MILDFSKDNHKVAMRKLQGLKKRFIKARIYTASGNVDFTTSDFDYLIAYAHTYYAFKADIKVA